MEKQGLARKEYWDDFYIDGDGCSEVYEWYTGFEVCSGLFFQCISLLYNVKTVEDLLTKYISENEFILHIGCGMYNKWRRYSSFMLLKATPY